MLHAYSLIAFLIVGLLNMMYCIFQDKSDDSVRKDVLNVSLHRTEKILIL